MSPRDDAGRLRVGGRAAVWGVGSEEQQVQRSAVSGARIFGEVQPRVWLNRGRGCSTSKRRGYARDGGVRLGGVGAGPSQPDRLRCCSLGGRPMSRRITVPSTIGRVPSVAAEEERWVSLGCGCFPGPGPDGSVEACVGDGLDARGAPVSGCPKTNSPPCRGGRPRVCGSRGGTALRRIRSDRILAGTWTGRSLRTKQRRGASNPASATMRISESPACTVQLRSVAGADHAAVER